MSSGAAAGSPLAGVDMDKYSKEVLDVIDSYRVDKEPTTKAKKKKDKPVFKPAGVTIPEGHKAFSDVFGWTPDDGNLPVRIFSENDWHESIRPYIPAHLPDAWVWPKAATEALALAMYQGDRTLLHGPTGAGKSALAEAWAFITGMPLIRVNCHREQQSTDFLGKDILKASPSGATVLEYDWSLTTLACKHGGMLLLDEAFRSPVLMAIQSLLERRGTLTLPDAASLTPAERRLVPPEDMFRVCLTDNTNGAGDTSGSYNAEVQDTSTLDRITATIFVDYLSQDDERRILMQAFPTVPEHDILTLITWAGQVRDAFKQQTIQQPVSMRAMNSILRKFTVHGNMAKAVELAYMAKLTTSERTTVSEMFHQVSAKEL
jgi:MoxR-like ATPase